MKKLVLYTVLLVLGFSANAQQLFLNQGQVIIDSKPVNLLRLNATNIFDSANAVLAINVGVVNQFTVNNTFNRNLQFTISQNGAIIQQFQLNKTTATAISLNALNDGVYNYAISGTIDNNSGVRGVLLVGNNYDYVWRIGDVDPNFSQAFFNNQTISKDYFPTRFSINGLVHPKTMQDSATKVYCKVGDTVRILMYNEGFMDHSMHVHGYHVMIEKSNSTPNQVGWSKDTFPIQAGRYVVVLLVPDKAGKYPVHDHYMGSVTTDGNYPGGMITMLDVSK